MTSEGPRRRLRVEVVNLSYSVSQHYRSCFTSKQPGTCHRLQDSYTILEDNVLRYRQKLMDNVRRVLNTTILRYENVTANVLPRNTT